MGRQKSFGRELAATLISTLVAAVGAFDLVGHPARTVHILTIFAGAFGAGMGTARLIARRRAGKEAAADQPRD